MLRKAIAALLLCSMLFLPGCWDSIEIDDQCFLLFLAIDTTEKKGTQLSTLVPPLSIEGGKSENLAKTNMVSVAGRDLFDAMDMLFAGLSLNVNLSQLKVIIISEEVAQDESFITLLKDLLSLRGLRRMASIVVCDGKAIDFAEKIKPNGDMQLSKSIEVAITSYQSSSYVPRSRLLPLLMQMEGQNGMGMAGFCALSPDYETGGELDYVGGSDTQSGDFYATEIPHRGVSQTEMFGSTIFNSQCMVMKLTGYETQLLCFLRGEGKYNLLKTIADVSGTQSSIYNETSIIVRAKEKPKITISEENCRYVIDIYLPLNGTLAKFTNESDEVLYQVERLANDLLQRDTLELLLKLKKTGLDPVGFSDIMARKFLTLQEWAAFDWDSAYRDAEIRLNTFFYLQWPTKEPGGLPMFFR